MKNKNFKFHLFSVQEIPHIGRRFVARLIDFIIVGFVLFFVEAILSSGWIFVGILSYFILSTYLWSTTPGKWIMGLKVLDSRTSNKPAFWQVLVREPLFMTILGLIGLLIFGSKGAYWDKVSKTTVVKFRSWD